MTIRRLNSIFVLVFIPLTLFSQRDKVKNDSWYDDKLVHFGFCVGLNAMDFKITPSTSAYAIDSLYPEVTRLNPGINIQVVTDYHPSPSIDIRFLPGVSFGQRIITFYKNGEAYGTPQSLESSFLEFPLILKYKGTRLNNVRPYVVTGLNYRYDLAGKKDYPPDKPIYMRLQRSDLYYEFGAGMDFYLTFFKLSVELKMSNGVRDVLVHDPAQGHPEYANAISKMRSQMWVISFHFE